MHFLERALTGLVIAIFALIFIVAATKHATAALPNRRTVRLAVYLAATAAVAYGCARYARGQ